MACFYHYTTAYNYNDLMAQTGDWARLKRSEPVIAPHFLEKTQGLPMLAREKAIFGFLEEQFFKTGYSDKSLFERLFEDKIADIPLVCLRLNFGQAAGEEVFVANHGVYLDPEFKTGYSHATTIQKVMKAYCDSFVPFFRYGENMAYTFPKIICLTDIPKDQISLQARYANKYEMLAKLESRATGVQPRGHTL
jgi:hypothetical protein